MTSLLFVLFILLAVAFMATKELQKKSKKHRFEKDEGNHPDRPLKIDRFNQMDTHLQNSRCPCGGRWMMRSEGSKSSSNTRLRVVHAECTRCESETDFFFDLAMMQN